MADAGVYIISIHAPRTGSDWVAYNVDNEMPISIHAPRTGSDSHSLCTIRARRHFNPRSPHGERHDGRRRTSAAAKDFNPRSPHGERRICFSRRFVL